MKTNYFKYLLIILSFANTISICLMIFQICINIKTEPINKTTDASSSSRVIIQVIDDFTNQPIEGVTICIIETRHYEITNKYGSTTPIEVPIVTNKNFDLYLKRNWGELTILAYKNGYADNLSLYNLVMPNTTRAGLIIRMREIINSEDNSPTISVNQPSPEWIETLIKLYKKRI